MKRKLNKTIYLCLFVIQLSGCINSSLFIAGPNRVAVKGEDILFNDKPVKLVGLRCSNALISERTTDDLIGALELYQGYGLNTISVFVMGSRYGDVKGYLPDATLNSVYRARLERILAATDQRNMIAIVGCLYWGASKAKEDLSGWTQEDANLAVANTAKWLREKGFSHVILDPDNEGMAVRENKWETEQLIQAAKAANPNLVVANNTHQKTKSEDLNIHFGQKKPGKPWLNSESTPKKTPGAYWGRFSKESHQKDNAYWNYSRIGRYTEEMKQSQIELTKEGLSKYNGILLASTWLQCPPTEGIGGPFTNPGGVSDLGSGKDDQAAWNTEIDVLHPDAGIRWWLEFVKNNCRD
jgi:hypothetical protein